MCKLSICRICLASEVQMYAIENTKLQVIYENICMNKLLTEDGRPSQVCYLCYTQLRKYHRLMTKARKSEDLLTQILNTGMELTENSLRNIDRQHYKLTENLRISSIEFTNVLEHDIQKGIFIKQEVPIEFEYDNVTMTEEGEYNVTSDPYLKELQIKNNNSQSDNQSDSEDDIPLKSINNGRGGTVQLKKNVNTVKKIDNVKRTTNDKAGLISTREKQQKAFLERANSLGHHNFPYKCEKCCIGFFDLNIYVEHEKKHDQREKRYSCTQCEYKCSKKYDLIKHIRTHTGEKPYSCTMCEYKCSQSGYLKEHMRKHSGKLFSCTLCKYKCPKYDNLMTHFRKHTGEKPYSCTLCEYKCSQNGHLKEHMKIHSGEKPYSCTLCDYRCAQTGHLKVHMRKH